MNQTMTENEAFNFLADRLEKVVLERLANRQAREQTKAWTPTAMKADDKTPVDLNGKFPPAHDPVFSNRRQEPSKLDQATKDVLQLNWVLFGTPENFAAGESLPRKAARCIQRLKDELAHRTEESCQLKTNLKLATAPVTELAVTPHIHVAVNLSIPEPTDPEASQALRAMSGQIATDILEGLRDTLIGCPLDDEDEVPAPANG